MKLMHSLPQQISITHRNGPHLRRHHKTENNIGGKSSDGGDNNNNKEQQNEAARRWSPCDERCSTS